MSNDAIAAPPSTGVVLALDTGSPVVSVAVGSPPEVLAERSVAQAGSSERLVAMIDEVLGVSGLSRDEVAGIVALRGPGSFTGLRIGLATAIGMHQALAIPATTLPTFEVLAACAADDDRPVLAVVDALRGEWSAQLFLGGRPPTSQAEPQIESAEALVRHAPRTVVGFGARSLVESAPFEEGVEALEPGPLAATILRHLAGRRPDWSPATLMDPLYLRPPAAKPAAGRRRP